MVGWLVHAIGYRRKWRVEVLEQVSFRELFRGTGAIPKWVIGTYPEADARAVAAQIAADLRSGQRTFED
jgi:hypothetical protein